MVTHEVVSESDELCRRLYMKLTHAIRRIIADGIGRLSQGPPKSCSGDSFSVMKGFRRAEAAWICVDAETEACLLLVIE